MTELFKNYPYILPLLEVLYLIGVTFLAVKIIKDTRTVSKTLAYLLLIIFLPLIGIAIYFLFGVNFRKNTFYKFKIEHNEKLYEQIRRSVSSYHLGVMQRMAPKIHRSENTINFLFKALNSPLTKGNHVELLLNGEQKFPKVFEILNEAKHHIHLEYYIFQNDRIGNQLADLLIKKAKEGVEVRFLYDDFGSRKIGKALIMRLKEAGVQTAPVNKIRFKLLANRVNYRDHRKIIIVDGEHIFTGGINVSDKYINPNDNALFWRDTHLYLRGNAAFYYQFLFLTNWVFAKERNLPTPEKYFFKHAQNAGDKTVQVAASGPDTKPTILWSTISAVYEAKELIYITTPYFIPDEALLNALKSQALAGVDVRLLVPAKGDSTLVNAAAFSYFEELLENKVRIFFYEKGFIHAKTLIIDDYFSSVGTANMDIRSQELNFEVNTHIYDRDLNAQLRTSFEEDLREGREFSLEDWQNRSSLYKFFEHFARLFSPLL